MVDVVVIGGGVIGLSSALKLAEAGRTVRVLDQGPMGQEASWAGAGMLPPGNPHTANTYLDWLRGYSHQLWADWAAHLVDSTMIDIGYRRCGSLEIRPQSEAESVIPEIEEWRRQQFSVEPLNAQELQSRFPALRSDLAGYWLADYAQVRNPRLLKALQTACCQRGVELSPGLVVTALEQHGERIAAVQTPSERIVADQYVVAAGAWSQTLLKTVEIDASVSPVRGQMVLLEQHPLPLTCLVQQGRRYLVPRSDGRLLVGATEEQAGFNKQNTADGIGGLLDFAQSLIPSLKQARFEQAWSGLRPHRSADSPWIGRAPAFHNLIIATGHFREGLALSPVTAALVSHLIHHEQSPVPSQFSDATATPFH